MTDPVSAFTKLPSWATTWAPLEGAHPDGRISPSVTVVLGKRYRKAVVLSSMQLALLIHSTLLGHSIATHSNNAAPMPEVYATFTFRDAPQDNLALHWLFGEVKIDQSTESLRAVADLRAPNLARIGKAGIEAETLALFRRHVLRLLAERELGGTLPWGFSSADYKSNFEALLWAVESEQKAALIVEGRGK